MSQNPLLDLFRRLFGLDSVAKRRFASQSDKAAFAAYDGLMGSYKTEIRFPVTVDGRTVWRTVSVADLGLIDVTLNDTSEREARAFIQRMIANGIVTRQRPTVYDLYGLRDETYPNAGLRTDARALNTSLLLEYPGSLPPRTWPLQSSGHGVHNPSLARVPVEYPTMKTAKYVPLFPTTRLVNPGDYTDSAFIADMQECIRIVDNLLNARNVNAAYHPLAIACSVPPFPRTFSFSGADNMIAQCLLEVAQGDIPIWNLNPPMPLKTVGDPTGNGHWTRNYTRGWRKPQGSGANAGPFTFNVGDPLWRDSLRRRIQLSATFGESSDGQFLQTVTADAVLDFMAAIALLDGIMQTSMGTGYSQEVLVDIHASATVYNVALKRSFDQLGLQYGTDILRYKAAMNAEANQRAINNRTNQVRSFGAANYNSHGNDVQDISAASIGTAQLAIEGAKAAGAAGAIVAVMISGFNALANYLSNESPAADPLIEQLYISDGGPAVWGITTGGPGVSKPFKRVR